MLLWEGLPSAQPAGVQAIFHFDERCRMAGDLVLASAVDAGRVFAFRPPRSQSSDSSGAASGVSSAALNPNERVTLVAADMAAGLRLIYTAAPERLRLLAARAGENGGRLAQHGRGVQSLPAFRAAAAGVRLLRRQARVDTDALRDALVRSGESLDAPESRVALSTGIWRLGVALALLLQSGREVTVDSTLGRTDQSAAREMLAAAELARSIVRPADWSSRAPVSLADLVLLSGAVGEHFTAALAAIVSDLRGEGLSDATIRTLLERRRAPRWLISQALRDDIAPWRRI